MFERKANSVTGKLENYSRDELRKSSLAWSKCYFISVIKDFTSDSWGEGWSKLKAESLGIDIINSNQCEEFLNDTKNFFKMFFFHC